MADGDEDWQVGKSLVECNQYMLENDISDVTFRVWHPYTRKTEEVTALRLLLLARSPVFKRIFSLATDRTPIDVLDVDPEAFKASIRYMYTDHVSLTARNVLAIKYVAEKYLLATLSHLCSKFLKKNLSAETAPVVLDQGIRYSEPALKAKALAVVKEEAETVFRSPEFPRMSATGLREVLQQDDLKVNDEVLVFHACIKWAEHQCQLRGKTPSGEHLREALGDNLQLIRFLAMSPEAFSDHVTPRELLTDAEELQILRYLTSKTKKPGNLRFIAKSRCSPNRPAAAPQPSASAQRAQAVMTPRSLWVQDWPVENQFRLPYGQAETFTSSSSCYVRTPASNNPPAAAPQPSASAKRAQAATTPRSLWVQGEPVENQFTLSSGKRKTITSSLSCDVTRAISLRKVYLHDFPQNFLSTNQYTVTLTQNRRILHTAEVTDPSLTYAYGTIPEHRTVDVPGVRVEAGTLQIQIQIRVRCDYGWYINCIYHTSPPGSCLSDDHIRDLLTADSHLMGIEYFPAK